MAEKARTQTKSPLRYIGFLFALALCIQAIGLPYSSLAPFSILVGQFTDINLGWTIGLAVVFALVFSFCYAQIGLAAQRPGADYILGSRVLSPALAFASSFALAVFSALTAGSLVASIPQTVLPSFLHLASLLTGADLTDAIAQVTSPQGVVMIGTFSVVCIYGASLLNPRWVRVIMIAGLVLTVVGWATLFFQYSTPISDFPSAWNALLGKGNYASHLQTAQNLSLATQTSQTSALLFGLFIGFWLCFGALLPTFTAGEIKSPKTTIPVSIWMSILVAGLLLGGVAAALQKVVPPEFLTAESLLSQSKSFSGLSMPYLTVYASVLHPSLPLMLLTALAWVFTSYALVEAYFFFISRMMLSWANDKIFSPSFLGFVHPTHRTPVIGFTFTAFIALVGLMDAAQPGRLFFPTKFALVAAFCMLIPVTAAFLLPLRRKAWFSTMPSMVRFKLGPVPLISLTSLVSLIFLIGVILSVLLLPSQLSAMSWMDAAAILICFILGILVYFNRRASLRKNGVNLEESFKELPQGE